MTSAMKATLVAIAVVLVGMIASFVWFVASWDKEAEQPIGFNNFALTEDRHA